MKLEKHYTTRAAAQMLSVTARTIRNWVKSGKLHGAILLSGTDIRIPASSLERFVADHTIRHSSSPE